MSGPQGSAADKAKRRATVAASRAVAVVACIFVVVVAALMIINWNRAASADPLNSPALMRLIEEAQESGDEALLEEVRALDLLARKAFFTSIRFSRIGALLLLAGVIVMLTALRSASAAGREGPDVKALAGDADTLAEARLARTLVATVGVALAALVVTFTVSGPERASIEIEVAAPAAVPEATTPDAVAPEPVEIDWGAFRGTRARAIADVESAPVDWDGESGRNVRWKAAVPLAGFSSPIVAGGRVFVSGGSDESREVYAFDCDSGELLWTGTADGIPGSPASPPYVASDTGYAAPTMTTDGVRVFAVFATGDLVAFDFDGERVWAKSLGVPDNPYGHASSPIVWRDLLIVQFDDATGGNLYAFATATGAIAWHTKREVSASWATPVIADFGQGDRVVVSAAPSVDIVDAATGELILSAEAIGGEVGPSPAVDGGLVFAANEYFALSAVDASSGEVVWEVYDGLPNTSSPLALDGLLYVATSSGVLTCFEANTGEVVWQEEFDEGFYSSPIAAAGNVYLMDRSGVMRIFRVGRKYETVGAPALGETSDSIPAFAHGRIYVRGEKHLYAIEAGND